MPKQAIISASMGKALMTKGRGKDNEYGATFYNEIVNVVSAGFFGYDITPDLSHLEAIQRGIEHEWLAVDAYQAETLNSVSYTGDDQRFIVSPDYPWIGATPDGLVGSDGLLEVKNPNAKNHWANLLSNEQLDDYNVQMQIQMLATGRQWVDWVSYDDDCPVPELRLHIHRVERDEAIIDEIIIRSRFAMSEAVKLALFVAETKKIKLELPEWSKTI
jgi:hypothetical protein